MAIPAPQAPITAKGPAPSLAALERSEADLERGLIEIMAGAQATARESFDRARYLLHSLDGKIDAGVVGPHLAGCGRTGVQLGQLYLQGFRALAQQRRAAGRD